AQLVHAVSRSFLTLLPHAAAAHAQWLAYALPYRRFADTLASANARLGTDADRYSFTVVDFHHLLLAGFNRRTRSHELCNVAFALRARASFIEPP
ncbi:MAG TPA: hypothetical protein VKI44_07575, partial [Acetobacteraceae bacterium]|nr:hypothetical protein [Acetobacteraceae bacterium]